MIMNQGILGPILGFVMIHGVIGKKRVPDADDVFLTWMTAECDVSLPKLSEALKTCPIEINEKDDYHTLSIFFSSSKPHAFFQ